MKNLFFLGLFSFVFTGCSFSIDSEKPHIFIPKESISASVFAGDLPLPESKFPLISQKLSPQKTREFRLYSSNGKPCAESREELTNLCIFEIWENNNKDNKDNKEDTPQKIFFFEETESGQFFEYYSGAPIGWKNEDEVIFEKIVEKKSGIKHLFSSFTIDTQEQKTLYQLSFWKDFATQEKNGFISFTKKGTQYFFDPQSYDNSFRGYRVLDPHQNFYVKSSGLENLALVDSLPEKNIQKVEWVEEFSDIIFEVTFLDENNKKQQKQYIFSGKTGFTEKK